MTYASQLDYEGKPISEMDIWATLSLNEIGIIYQLLRSSVNRPHTSHSY